MKATPCVALALLATAASRASATQASRLYPHVPLVLWSTRATFNDRLTYVSETVDDKATMDIINTVLSRDTAKDTFRVLSRETTAETPAEALCVFVYENLKTSQLAALREDAFVDEEIKNAKSSVVLAHTTRALSLTQGLASVNYNRVLIDNVQAWTRSAEGKKRLRNGQPDLVVVEIPPTVQLSELGDKLKTASAALLEATNDQVDFALTGDTADHIVVEEQDSRPSSRPADAKAVTADSINCDAGYRIGMSSSGKAYCFSHYVHMTPQILTALIFGFFFLFLAYVGISALHAIQTPRYFPLHGPPKGKEF